jgi:alkaline phosphatase D
MSEPGNDEPPMPRCPLTVRWELAKDEAFHSIVARAMRSPRRSLRTACMSTWAACSRIAGTGTASCWAMRSARSRRTRTAPAPEADAGKRSSWPYASCQHWEFGDTMRRTATSPPMAPDLVAFLGDYIYEWGPTGSTHPAPGGAQQRELHAGRLPRPLCAVQERPDLQASHHAAPWIVTWDDHEVANDYGGLTATSCCPAALPSGARRHTRRSTSTMPVRPEPAHAGRFADMRIYERYDWGRLARFHVLDDRQYRSPQACPRPAGRGGSSSVVPQCLRHAGRPAPHNARRSAGSNG